MTIRPLHNRILIKRAETETHVGRIIVPDIAKERPVRATVRAVGERRSPKGLLLPPVVRVGDEVLVGKYAGIEVRFEGELLALVDESEVVGTIEPERGEVDAWSRQHLQDVSD